jgi:hypothetical protein
MSLRKKTMSQLAAMKAGMTPRSITAHPEHDGELAIETVKWTNDHWRGKRKDTGEFVRVADFTVGYASGVYSELDRWCTVHYRIVRG